MIKVNNKRVKRVMSELVVLIWHGGVIAKKMFKLT